MSYKVGITDRPQALSVTESVVLPPDRRPGTCLKALVCFPFASIIRTARGAKIWPAWLESRPVRKESTFARLNATRAIK